MSTPLVIVGDTLLDVDLVGTAGRLSPDGPVPVLNDLAEHPRPGGAGLAAVLAARRSGDVTLVTALGADAPGERVERLLAAEGVEVLRLPYDGPTPVKTRVRAGGQTLVRLDSGEDVGRFATPPAAVAERLRNAAAVLVSDYGRGVTADPALRALLESLSPRTPLVWDPHPRGAVPVAGTTFATPNAAEAAHFGAAAASPAATPSPASAGTYLGTVRAHADALHAAWGCQAIVVTMGAHGALLSYGSGAPAVIPAPVSPCLDPCGAGDCFAVTAALALAHGRLPAAAVEEAVRGAAAYVAAGGPASLGPTGGAPDAPRTATAVVERVRAAGGTVVATGGCFDLLHAGHVATLRAARGLGDCLVVCLNSDDSVRRLKGPTRPLVPAADRARVLEALEFVDAVEIFDEDTPVTAIRRLRPDLWAKGGDYAGADTPESAVVAQWGGQAVVLPYLEGRSTTRLVQTAADRNLAITNKENA